MSVYVLSSSFIRLLSSGILSIQLLQLFISRPSLKNILQKKYNEFDKIFS